jgi:hypothetical protein
VGVETNKAEAASISDLFSASTLSNITANSNSVSFTAHFTLNPNYNGTNSTNTLSYYDHIAGDAGTPGQGISFLIKNNGALVKQIWLTSFSGNTAGLFDLTKTDNVINANSGSILTPSTIYTINIEIDANLPWSSWSSDPPISFKTAAANTSDATNTNATATATSSGQGSQDFDCGITNLGGCVAQIFYALWVASSWIAKVGGYFLDFFVYYSTNSNSYTNPFVTQGWGAVRDIANIFFIIALLYIAIKTVLSLNVTDNKKLISAVIIVALIINFSLFATELVIDASNILAKVFYNNINSVDTRGNAAIGSGGQKSISIGLIDKFNPQQIAMTVYNQQGVGYFIFITVLLMAVTLYTGYVFFSVALLFVGRVISLWIAMIFSPIAFASYSIPFDIPGFGHKEWWKGLLENAFLAPLFIFFLYLIVLFTGFLSSAVTYNNSTNDVVQQLLTILIPFVFIVVLLKKSKDLAVKYSGEMGAAISKAGAMVGGLALGAATGGAALAGRGIIGGIAQRAANNDETRAKAAAGDKGAQRKLDRANKWAGRSFDFRQTGIGKGFGKATGLDLNKGTGFIGLDSEKFKGGKKAKEERKYEKDEARMKSYEMTPSEAAKQKEKADKYKNDDKSYKEEYNESLNTGRNAGGEAWKTEYEAKARANRFSANPVDEKTFEENYKKNNPPPAFNEAEFKKEYEKNNPPPAKVETVEEVNSGRRTAYAYSLAHPMEKGNEDRGEIRNFLKEWRSGMANMLTTKGGLGTTALAGALTGGIGAALAIPLGGLVQAIKATIPANKELVARIAKGKTGDQKLLELLRKSATGNKKAEEELLKEVKKGNEEKKEESHK